MLFERLLSPPKDHPRKEVPTLQEFAPRFVDGHARANRQKPSGIASKTMILRLYLIPAFGRRHLDAIKSEDVQRLKAQLEIKSPKTVNNILAVLSILLKKAVEWDVIERMPCRIKLLPIEKGAAAFHDFEAYERLVDSRCATISARACARACVACRRARQHGCPLPSRLSDTDGL